MDHNVNINNNMVRRSSFFSRQTTIGALLAVALLAFELFNFDTTQFALQNLLGQAEFAGILWATILAFAFCAIDFAGLAHLFTPLKFINEGKEVYFLTAAWLLGAALNALMTWWAISLLLIQQPLAGNEILSRQQLLTGVPIFVAALVWLTRILFIGAISIAGDRFFYPAHAARPTVNLRRPVRAMPGRKRHPVQTRPRPKGKIESGGASRPIRQTNLAGGYAAKPRDRRRNSI